MRLVALLACAWVIAGVTRAVAQPTKREWIVVAADDPAFRGALVEALAPAGMTVIVVASQPAPAAVGELAAASRALCEREHATATVWLTPSATGATLVTYDRDRDRLLVRDLPYGPPLSAFQAVEAARTARTMLRALRITPDDDRPPPLAADAPEIRESAPLRDRPLLAAGGIAGYRVRAPGNDVGGDVIAIVRPDALGVAAIGEFSPSLALRGAFDGHAYDATAALVARWPLRVPPLGGRIRVVPMAGAALHFVRLTGALTGDLADMQHLHGTRVDPAIRVGGAMTYRVGSSLDVGLAVSLDALVQRQRYVVESEEVLEIPRVQAMFGAIATFWIL